MCRGLLRNGKCRRCTTQKLAFSEYQGIRQDQRLRDNAVSSESQNPLGYSGSRMLWYPFRYADDSFKTSLSAFCVGRSLVDGFLSLKSTLIVLGLVAQGGTNGGQLVTMIMLFAESLKRTWLIDKIEHINHLSRDLWHDVVCFELAAVGVHRLVRWLISGTRPEADIFTGLLLVVGGASMDLL
ncbi:hypothetical protein Tco_0924592 [Tanacetum coccineum]|uniref:Uncharacterized protein n=1 Tax=Tanacetum coccineum TaxID=301880 RepID=A0ABQ5D6H4_9ASTR